MLTKQQVVERMAFPTLLPVFYLLADGFGKQGFLIIPGLLIVYQAEMTKVYGFVGLRVHTRCIYPDETHGMGAELAPPSFFYAMSEAQMIPTD